MNLIRLYSPGYDLENVGIKVVFKIYDISQIDGQETKILKPRLLDVTCSSRKSYETYQLSDRQTDGHLLYLFQKPDWLHNSKMCFLITGEYFKLKGGKFL